MKTLVATPDPESSFVPATWVNEAYTSERTATAQALTNLTARILTTPSAPLVGMSGLFQNLASRGL